MEAVEKADYFPELSDTDLSFCWGHTVIHEWAECEAMMERPVCAGNVHKRQSLQTQARLLLRGNVKQVIRSFPHTGDIERGPSTCAEIQEIPG